MDQSVELQKQFNAVSAKYDRQRPLLIPCFQDFYRMALKVADQVESVHSILDIGAGTGLLSAFFKQKFPKAHCTLVDFSEEMLQKAKTRFIGEEGFSFRQEDITQADFGEDQYNLVISSLAIHHLEDEQKKVLFQKIHKSLRKGGYFINADQVLGENETAEAFFKSDWTNHVLNQQKLTAEEKETAFKRVRLDKMAKLSDQLRWLEEAQLYDAHCYYQYMNFVVFAAHK